MTNKSSPSLRGLLVEAAQSAVRHEPEMRLAAINDWPRAEVSWTSEVRLPWHKLAVRLYWMLRLQVDYAKAALQGSHAGQLGT